MDAGLDSSVLDAALDDFRLYIAGSQDISNGAFISKQRYWVKVWHRYDGKLIGSSERARSGYSGEYLGYLGHTPLRSTY